jgi:O-antigen/teichoic acid export membrane protein
LLLVVVSLPLVAALGWLLHSLLLSEMPLLAFAAIVAGEMCWRLLEVVHIIKNGFRQFGSASAMLLAGSLLRTLVAVAFWLLGYSTLESWAWFYLLANALAMMMAWLFFLPPMRWRLRPRLYLARAHDALSAATADIIFYLQAELDKAVVLGTAGARVAGLYAIAMRIIDITAMPIRVFNQLAMQQVMTDRGLRQRGLRLAAIELGIALVSTLALGAVIIALWLKPDLLGRNVASASVLFPLLIAVPMLRNLIEYHAELLYGQERTGLRALLLGTIALFKAAMIWLAVKLATTDLYAGLASLGELAWAPFVNLAFLLLYALSAVTTYTAMKARVS